MKQFRPKQPDWNKAFRIVQKREDFLKIQGNEAEAPAVRPEPQKKKDKENKKDDIVVPKIDVLNKPPRAINEAGIPLNFIRITSKLNLPKVDRYELSEVDYIFLVTNENKYLYGGRKVLTVDFLERAIVELELLAGKDSTVLPKDSDKRLRALIEKEYPYILNMDNYEDFVKLVNTHWKNRRQQLKTPLLRVLWKPNPEDSSHYLAFRPREKEEKEKKKQLRRQNKPTEEETIMNLEGIQKEFEDALSITERVRMRERLKLDSVALRLQKLNQALKEVKEEPVFNPQVSKEDLAKHKENFVKMTKQFQSKKAVQEVESEKIQEQAVQNVPHAIVNFIATLCNKCVKLNIDIDTTVYGSKLSGQLVLQPQASSQAAPIYAPMPLQKGESSIAKSRQQTNICKFNMRQLKLANSQVFLERDFGEFKRGRESDMEEHKGVDSYFNQRHRSIKSVYFFEDDEEEFKDMRKNTSNLFKRWKQTKAV